MQSGVRSSAERLPLLRKAAYGAGELGPAMAGSTMIFFQLVFLTNVAGLQPGLAGSVLLTGKIWDAVNDPLIGWLSDRTRTRFGRRIPWMVLCAVPFALFFFLNWCVPGFVDGSNQWGLFAYYTGASVLFNTFYTGMALTHSSLTPELSHDYDERSRITGFRMAFSLGGSVGGLVVALVVFRAMATAPDTVKYAVMAASVAVLGVVAMAVCVGGIWREAVRCDHARAAREIPRLRPGAAEHLKILLSNRPFLLVCGIYLFSWLAMQFTASIMPYYVTNWLGMPPTRFQAVALAVQLTALVLIPFWGWLCVKIGKKPVYFYGMVFWLVAQAGLWFLRPGDGGVIFLLAVMAGVGISVCYLVPNAMLPDVIELDELETGERREGVYYGCFVFLQKIALALGSFIVGQALAVAGYQSSGPGDLPPEQPATALTAIRVAIGPLPAFSILLGMLLAAFYPINKRRHAEILEALARRGAQETDGADGQDGMAPT
jgi:glycoside/pentoside/hexuronide:cation symporter, GPH family